MAFAGPERTVTPLAVPLPVAAEAPSIAALATPVLPVSQLPTVRPSEPAAAAPPIVMATLLAPVKAQSALPVDNKPLSDTKHVAISAVEPARAVAPVKPPPTAAAGDAAKDAAEATEMKTTAAAQGDTAPSKLAARESSAAAAKETGSVATAKPEAPPRLETLASAALPTGSAVREAKTKPVAAAPPDTTPKPAPADAIVLAAKPAEPSAVKADASALAATVVAKVPPPAPIALENVPLPRASPRRVALATSGAPHAEAPNGETAARSSASCTAAGAAAPGPAAGRLGGVLLRRHQTAAATALEHFQAR